MLLALNRFLRLLFPPSSVFISKECEDKTTFLLEEATDIIVKRSVDDSEAVAKHNNVFTEFTGKAIVKYNIVNLNEI